MQSQVFVVFDLALEKEEDHAYRNDVFGQIPDLALKMQTRDESFHKGRGNKDARPSEEPRDCNKSSRGGTPLRIPEVNTAAEVDGKKHRIQCQCWTVARPVLKRDEEN